MGYSPQELADRAEIHDVIVRYGWAIDTKDWALLDTCFTADADVDYSSNPGGKEGPYREIRAWLEKMISRVPGDAAPDVEHRRHARRRPRDGAHDGDEPAGRGARAKVRCTSSTSAAATTTSSSARPRGGASSRRVEDLWFEGTLPRELYVPEG